MPELTGRMVFDLPASEYHKRELGVASNSGMKLIRERSPAHYKAWCEGEQEKETPALAFGRAYHCRVLEPDVFARTYKVMPDFGDMRSSTNRAKRDEWLAENPGAEVISQDYADRIEAMYTALMAHPVAAGIMRNGKAEVTMYWVDPDTGVKCKARADWWVPGKFFMDLKTTDDASPQAFARSIAKYGYHVQHAHYCDGARECGEAISHYLILAQEKEAPYLPAVYHIDAEAEQRGFALRHASLQSIASCIKSGNWPGYGAGISEITLPAWALKE